ncbi:MAG: porin [Muribaculaceae bacterium]|nr:porin [Muribaculaceae bacterium]
MKYRLYPGCALLAASLFFTFSSAMAVTGGFSSEPGVDTAGRTYPEEELRRQLIKESKVIFINGDEGERADRDSVESMMLRFYYDQFRSSQDPEAPMFTFMSKNADLVMGIGATLKVRGMFDWNGSVPNAGFNTYLINMPKTPENWRQLRGDAAGSSIFFNLMGRHTVIGDYRVYIQGGFNGYGNSGFKLKKAWLQVRDFTVGLAPTTFSDPAAQPDLLDGAGANGKIDKTNVLVRYLHTFKGRWSVAGSLEFPSSNPDVDDATTKKCNDYIPDVAALGQYQWNRGLSHVRIAALLRTMSYRDLLTNETRHRVGWGVMLGTTVRAGRYIQFFGQTSVGKGISAYTGDLSSGNYDLLANPLHPGELYAPTTLTGTVGLKAFWMPRLTSTFAVATLRNFATDGTHDATYKYGQFLAVNLLYNITPRIQCGLEYLAGKRMNFNRDHANANRLEAVLTASF